jgi:hypothetical protein
MNTSVTAVNMQSLNLTDLGRDRDRGYLVVLAITDVVVTISGGEPFTVVAGASWAPIPVPINDIDFTGTGVLTVDSLILSDAILHNFTFQNGSDYTFQDGSNYEFN